MYTVKRVLAFIVCGFVFLAAPALAQDKPNILVIFGDDVGMWNISAYHRGMMGGSTPNIDRLADEGALFTLDVSGNFNDPDGDALTFTATGLPAFLAR